MSHSHGRAVAPPLASSATDERRHRVRERILTQPEASHVARSTNAIVLAHGEIFMLSLSNGDIPWNMPHGLGLFHRDCRFLDAYTLSLNGRLLTPLDADDSQGFRTRHHLANRELRGEDDTLIAPKNTIAVTRERVIRGSGCRETLTLHNYGRSSATVVIELHFRAKFEDIFVLRGFSNGPRGMMLPATVLDDHVDLGYHGADQRVRTLSIAFSSRPSQLTDDCARFDLTLVPEDEWTVDVTFSPRIHDSPPARAADGRLHESPPKNGERWLERMETVWLDGSTEIHTSHPMFDRALNRSRIDLGRLRSKLDGLHYYAAGLPWFGTLFGRDAALTAMLTLPFESRTAADTLRLLARYQATAHDEFRDAEPGKILHEMRRGELAHVEAIPQSPAYYGSIDATLLFLILLAEYLHWSGDLALARELRPHVDAALRWIDESADHDHDGYLDYVGEYEHGLINQGWKDSGNAIVTADGERAEPPIALCEVQGYLYRAWRQTARWLRALDDGDTADDLDRRAQALRDRFARDFWSEELGCYLMGLQRGGRPLSIVSSNAGQVLWSGIAIEGHARRVAARLLAPDMFSGWGVRTLSSEARAYNPLGYHLGTVWPHDNALIVGGLLRYGLVDSALTVMTAIFEAAAELRRQRLPELYCGHPRDRNVPRPVSYPVACSPQAWAAAALPAMLASMLGLQPDAAAERLALVRPTLPEWLASVTLRRMRIGRAVVDITFTRNRDGSADAEADVREGRLTLARDDDHPPHAW